MPSQSTTCSINTHDSMCPHILTCRPGGSSGTVMQWGKQTEAPHGRHGQTALPRLPSRRRCCWAYRRAAAACGPGCCCSGPERVLPGFWAETGHRTDATRCSLEEQTAIEQRVDEEGTDETLKKYVKGLKSGWGMYQASRDHVPSACWERPGPKPGAAQTGTTSPSGRPPSCDPACSV